MDVWSGESIGSIKTVTHPKSKRKDGKFAEAFDLGMIKLERPAPLDTSSNGQMTNNIICLPSKAFNLTKQSLAMIAGHGTKLTRATIGTLKVREVYFKREYRRIYYQGYYGGQQICPVSFKIEYFPCIFYLLYDNDLQFQGDSGSPIWMYHMGRAFLVGVHAAVFGGN